jgi:hypothetical protein
MNDLFSYCQDIKRWDKETKTQLEHLPPNSKVFLVCEKSPLTCKLKFNPPAPKIDLSKPPVFTQKPPVSKPKDTKKEIIQGSLF